ncbi:hypothetical protein MTR_2g047922 [Medicago truncatula]|uniref:Uncharacterized protein n=1 Tax=Medicago truncatula TaxID=3880 RepID=A0A072V856_MEDTR|nr:hypothetical protein MTR_2g047922 [Medicago truncatula]
MSAVAVTSSAGLLKLWLLKKSLQENVKYLKFRYQGLEFLDELEFIYRDAVATSQHQWTPALGVPLESNGKNTTTNVPQEIIDSDDSEFNIGDHFSPMEYTQPKKKRKVSPNIGEKVTKGKAKVGTTTTMRKTFERAKDDGFLNGQQFSYALEMLKDEQNRVLLMTLKDSKEDLVEWVLYNYVDKKPSNI